MVWEGNCFSTEQARLRCTLLARWDDGYDEPWLILTGLRPQAADIAWYSVRTWIEQGYKDTKRGGLRWEQTKITDPGRATRLWLVIALVTLWIVGVGGLAGASLSAGSLGDFPSVDIAPDHFIGHPQPRRLSCFCRGIIAILIALIRSEPLPLGRFIPELWPTHHVEIASTHSLHPALAHAFT